MHHVALNGAGANDGDLDHQVVKLARLETWQHCHLCPAFDLKDADAVALAEHVVSGGVVWRDACESVRGPLVTFEHGECLADAGQHAEGQHIHFHDAQRVYVVLVPFNEGALLHRRIADGHGFDQRPACQHETADMLGEVAREAQQLPR